MKAKDRLRTIHALIPNKELSEAEVRKTVEQLNQQLSQVMNANNDVNFKG